ncbi:MAG: hypothetical protein IPF70_08530 [Saprospiraceae bacterium]|nr:hypothetical protein [Saprospiraceae bacterium]
MEKVFKRLLLYYRKNYTKDLIVYTNLGIDNTLRIALPVLQGTTYFLFGKPESYKGEYFTLQLTSLLTQDCSAFIDVGANWGFFSYYVSHYNPSIPVHWFELNTTLYQSIVANTACKHFNKMQGSLQALSDINGKISFT